MKITKPQGKHTTEWYVEPCKHPALEMNMEEGQLYMLVPSSGIGSYASQPHGTHRPTPTMLMEIVILLQTHTIQLSMAVMPNSVEDWNHDHAKMQHNRSWSNVVLVYYVGILVESRSLGIMEPKLNIMQKISLRRPSHYVLRWTIQTIALR